MKPVTKTCSCTVERCHFYNWSQPYTAHTMGHTRAYHFFHSRFTQALGLKFEK